MSQTSHRHLACKTTHPSSKCNHIDCECSTHLSDSSEHVICKWDTSEQHMSQFSPLTGPRLESYSNASCIDTGGIRVTPMSPNDSGGIKVTPMSSNDSRVDSANVSGTQVAKHQGADKTVQDSTGVARASYISRGGEEDLNRLKSELAETQTVLQKTEEHLLQQIEQNQHSVEIGQSGTRSLAGYHGNSSIGSLHDVIGHLYLNKEDAKKLLTTVKARLQDLGSSTAPDKSNLHLQLLDLQVVLEEVIRGRGRSREPSVTFDLASHDQPSESDDSHGINLVENLRQKLTDKEAELHRWEVLVEQLHKELDQARLRSESNTNALYSKQEECRAREDDLQNARLKAERLEHILGTIKSKENKHGQTRTTQTDMTHVSHHQTAEGALSQLTARLHQQQVTASELQLEREHNQRLQELRLGVVEAGNRWEREVMTLDLQAKQLTQQLEDARKQTARLEEEKNHQNRHLQEMKESLKQVMSNRDEISSELADTQGERAKVNQQLAAAQTALTYERNTNEKLREECSDASQTQLQLNEELNHLKDIERQLNQQLTDSQRGSSELRKQCSTLCSDLEQANEELQNRSDIINRLQAEIEVTMTTAKAQIENEIVAANSSRVEWETSLQAANKRIIEMQDAMTHQDKELKVLEDTKKEMELQRSESKHQEAMIKNLQAELKESQNATQEQSDENEAICKQREAVKRDLEVALVRQKSYKEWGVLHQEKLEEALKRWEEEKCELTNRITALQVTLKENECSLQTINESNLQNSATKERLQERCESLQQQIHTKDVGLQTTLERLSNTQRQLQEERRAKDACERDLKSTRSSLEKKESSLHSQTSKLASLETMKTNLKAMTQTQKATIAALQKQLKQNQNEFVNYKKQIQTNISVEKDKSERIISELQQKLDLLQNDMDHSKQKNHRLAADLKLMSDSLEQKRTEHSELLLNLHKLEQREGEFIIAQQQLTHQLQGERDSQASMTKRLEEQEAHMAELQHSLVQQQEDQESPEKTLLLDHLKDSLDSSFRLELNQLKAEISRQATITQNPSPSKKMSDHDKVLILQRELSRLRTLHTADQNTVAMLTEDMTVMKNRLIKQKALILNSKTQRIRKSDIQAALAKAQAKALVMSPLKQQKILNFDPGNFYGIPRSAFDDCALHGFSSDQVTPGSTAFSGGSSDCDYSS